MLYPKVYNSCTCGMPMKHTLSVTVVLILIFLFTQLFGLYTVYRYVDVGIQDGKLTLIHEDTALGEQPRLENKDWSFIPLLFLILIGTALIFALMRFKLGGYWKYGFVLSVFLALAVALGVYISFFYALIIAALLAYWKVFRPNPWMHNLTEVFIYPGITLILLPYLNIFSGIIMLLLIAVYDAIAVWKSKHMITLAKFQTSQRAFAGVFVPYAKSMMPHRKVGGTPKQGKTAILGGGDLAFPLLFGGVVYESLLLQGITPGIALLQSAIIGITSTIALAILLFTAEKGKFYPAMVFLSAGCLIGYGVLLVI